MCPDCARLLPKCSACPCVLVLLGLCTYDLAVCMSEVQHIAPTTPPVRVLLGSLLSAAYLICTCAVAVKGLGDPAHRIYDDNIPKKRILVREGLPSAFKPNPAPTKATPVQKQKLRFEVGSWSCLCLRVEDWHMRVQTAFFSPSSYSGKLLISLFSSSQYAKCKILVKRE